MHLAGEGRSMNVQSSAIALLLSGMEVLPEFGNLAWPTSAVCFGPPLGTLMLRVLGSAGA